MGLLSEACNLETTPCLGGCASVPSCLPSPVLLFSCQWHYKMLKRFLRGGIVPLFWDCVCGDAQAQRGCDSTPASTVLASAQFARAARVVVRCPSSSASSGSETASSRLKASAELSHLKCQRRRLWGRRPRARGRKKERGRGGKGHKQEDDTLKKNQWK